MKTKILTRNKVLFDQTDFPDGLYIVKSGKILLFKEGEGSTFLHVDTAGVKDIVGEISALQNKDRGLVAIAYSESELVHVPIQDIQSVLTKCPEWINDIINTLCGRLNSLIDLMSEHRIHNDQKYLVELSEEEILRYRKIILDYRKE